MKKLSMVLMVPCFMAVFTLDIDVQAAKKKKLPDAVPVTGVTPPARASFCPDNYDLAASVTSIATGSDSTGPYVRVTGKVKNIGGQDFTSTRTMAKLHVIEYGNAAGPQIKSINITRLNKEQSVTISGTYHLSNPAGFEWCGWGCVPLRGGICKYLSPSVTVQYWDNSEKSADCNASNNVSPDRAEHHVHFIRRCTE